MSPPKGSWALRRFNEYRLGRGERAIFGYPHLAPDQAHRLARPTCTGFGDLLCAWMMPMALSQIMGWELRIPVPRNAGGLHHDPSRPQITPEWAHATLGLPSQVRLVAAETAPDDEEWFCTLGQQWHLDSCMQTSYETIPWWLRGDIDRSDYYAAYRQVAQGLVRAPATAFADGRPYFALNARRRDRGQPHDDQPLLKIISELIPHCRDWTVISDDPQTASMLRDLLRSSSCRVAEPPGASADDDSPDDPAERRARLMLDFGALVGARAVVCSVRGGWSAFPYAATRISGAPLVFAESLDESIVWRVIRGHSKTPIPDVHHGPRGVSDFFRTPRP